MKKLYYAYVAKSMDGYFKERLEELKDKIKVVRSNPAMSKNDDPLLYYELEAEEGIIDPTWELKSKGES